MHSHGLGNEFSLLGENENRKKKRTTCQKLAIAFDGCYI